MKSTRFTLLLAVVAVCSIASAQPAPDAATTGVEPQRPERRGPAMREGGGMGPFAKLDVARRLENLTEDQKAKLTEFAEKVREEGQVLQSEFRESMTKAREATDRESRREIMEGIRGKYQEAEQRVDAFLSETLTAEQKTTLEQRATGLRDRAADRVRRFRDGSTTASARQTTAGQMRRGERGEGRRGERRRNRDANRPAAPATSQDARDTTGSQVNPFRPADQ